MSKFVKIKTELRDLALIKQALDDLKLAYKENSRFTHLWSGFHGKLPLVIQHRGVAFGLRPTEEGHFEFVGDDMHLNRARPLMKQIQQRYAYHMVLSQVEEAGFDLVEETVGKDQVIRLTVRRWQ